MKLPPLLLQIQVQRLREGVSGQRAAEEAPLHPRPGGQVRVRHLWEEVEVQAVTGRPSERPSGEEALRVRVELKKKPNDFHLYHMRIRDYT